MKNIGCNEVALPKQSGKKQAWKKLFLKRQIRKQKAWNWRGAVGEKDYSVAESTVYE